MSLDADTSISSPDLQPTASSQDDRQDSGRHWGRIGKAILSVLIAFHLLAVVSAPLWIRTMGPFGASPIVNTLSQPTRGYGQFLYLDRGYAFFAPDPGPSHLIQAAITSEDGTRKEIMIPDLDDQWPRLMYHRHFMLAEYLNEIYQPKGPPQELIQADREAAEEWTRLRARYEHVRDSVLDHLRDENPGKEVAIRRIEHLVPELSAYLDQPIALNDKQLYRVQFDNPLRLGPLPTAVRNATTSDASPNSATSQGVNQELNAPATGPRSNRPPETVPVPQAERAKSKQADATPTSEPVEATARP